MTRIKLAISVTDKFPKDRPVVINDLLEILKWVDNGKDLNSCCMLLKEIQNERSRVKATESDIQS